MIGVYGDVHATYVDAARATITQTDHAIAVHAGLHFNALLRLSRSGTPPHSPGDRNLLANVAWAAPAREILPGTIRARQTPNWAMRTGCAASIVWRMDWGGHESRLYVDGLLLNAPDLRETINGDGSGRNPLQSSSLPALPACAVDSPSSFCSPRPRLSSRHADRRGPRRRLSSRRSRARGISPR